MNNFTYARATDSASAIQLQSGTASSKFLGGGTNLVDLMRENIERPDAVVDVTAVSSAISESGDGGIMIGASARNTAVAGNTLVLERFPVLSQAILNGASGQIRNMATVGGNIMQRTRCYYFYDSATRCNKRDPGSGCDAIHGHNRIHAILGTSQHCIATHPSDMCVALVALDAMVHLESASGTRVLPLRDVHRLPGNTPDLDTNIHSGELITSVHISPLAADTRSLYRKVRDRSSYAFALVSVAALLRTEGGVVRDVRLALGGVAHKPWRATAAEAVLMGSNATEDNFLRAAQAELNDAVGFEHNTFKIELARRVMVGALLELANQEGAAS